MGEIKNRTRKLKELKARFLGVLNGVKSKENEQKWG